MTKTDTVFCTIAILLLLSILIFLCFDMGRVHSKTEMQKSAIKAGVAEWTIDKQTGEKEFKWLTDK